MSEERMKMQMKEDSESKRYYDLIKNKRSKFSQKFLKFQKKLKKTKNKKKKECNIIMKKRIKKE